MSNQRPGSGHTQKGKATRNQTSPGPMANIVQNRTGQCETTNDRTDSIRCVTKCLHEHVGHTILISALHPATCRQVVNALNSKKKQGSDDRRERAVPLTEIKDRLEDKRRGNDWNHMGYQEVIYEVIRDFFDALGIWRSGSRSEERRGG